MSNLGMARTPVTVYKEDPQMTPHPAEWEEIWIGYDGASGQWVVCKRHGWWDEANKQSLWNVPTLSLPFKTQSEANAAMDDEIERLDQQGWIHKFTTTINYMSGTLIGHKLS